MNRWPLLLAFLLPALPAHAGEFVYVQNTFSGDVTVIAIPRHEVVSTIKVGRYPDDVTAAPDGRTIYVNRIDSAGLKRAPNVGDTGEVMAIDPLTDRVLWRVPVDGMPHHMTVTRDGKQVFVPYFNGIWVGVIDTEKRAVVGRIAVGYGSHGTRLSPDGKRVYVGSMMNDHISVIDVATREVIKQIPFEDGVRPFEITSDEKWMFVQLSRLHGFKVVDLEKGRVVQTVALPPLPEGTRLPQFYPHTYNHGMAISRDEKLLFVAGSVASYIAVYSLPGLQLVKTIPVGSDPNWIAFSADNKFAYVSNRASDDLSVLSVDRLEEVKRLKVGTYPQRVITLEIPGRD